MTPRVLIAIDVSRRELFGCTLLAQRLHTLGVSAICCSIHAFRSYAARYRPHAVVWPNAITDLSGVAKRAQVFIMPSESGNGQHEQIIMHAGTPAHPAYPAAVTRFYCWGATMRDLLAGSGRWKPEQLLVTGSPATDHWLLPETPQPPEVTTVGITTTFRALSNSITPARTNYFWWLDKAERRGNDGTYYVPPEHAESWLFFEASLARVMVGAVRHLQEHSSARVAIRPHPFERKSRYDFFHTLAPGRVTVSKRGTISEWLRSISILFTHASGSALDAVIRGVPVVSLRGLLDPDAVRKIPPHFRYTYDAFLWQVNTLEDAMGLVERAGRRVLPPCQDPEGFRQFLAQYFAFPRSQPAAWQIAEDIVRTLHAEPSPRSSQATDGFRLRERALAATPGATQALALLRYLNGKRPGRMDIGASYQPWRVWDRREVRRAVRHVIERSA